ncbi:MAG: MFS transporter [Bacilli bacterium]|nr:MFS transporter [Bacilli bacterium]
MAKSKAGGGILSSRIKSANVKFFPEALLGYLGGPFFALIPNGIINVFLMQYWTNVLGLSDWAYVFTWLMPLLSSVLIVAGNILVGKLMEGKPKKAGKARPLMVLSVPAIAVALVALFLTPYPEGATAANPNLLTLIVVAIGYNLFYAFAWPLYYTSHSAMVNLSTRNASQRSLLGTMAMAGQVGAAGVAGMAGGVLMDLLGLLPNEANLDRNNWFIGKTLEQARQEANSRWIIIDIVLIAALVIGVAIEFLFTRERISEEQFALADRQEEGESKAPAKKVKMGDQIKVCVHDKYWWIIIIFFLMYQFGGMLKNNGQNWYAQAWTEGDTTLSSLIGTLGAIPTALGMVIIWPLANKFGKAVTIKWGAALAVLLGLIGWIPLFINTTDVTLISVLAILGFCLKAIGTVPAMYVSLALMSDVLDHQEAVYGIRTDGFTMSVYGSIMIAMTGVSNAILVGVCGPQVVGSFENKFATTFLFFGGEMICYLVIFIALFFMNVEKFSDLDHAAIDAAQKAEAEAAGIPYVPAKIRLEQEQRKAEEEAYQSSVDELRAKCEKNGSDFDAALKEFEAAEAKKKADAEAKKAAAEAKKAEALKAKEAAKAQKLASLSPEQKAAYDEAEKRKAEKAAKEAEELARTHAKMVEKGHALLG